MTSEKYSVARDKVQMWGKDMILTLELNKNNTMILKWPKVTFFKGSCGNHVVTETNNGQTVKLIKNVRLWLIRDRLKMLEMSQVIPSFWFAQLVPCY